MNELRATRPWEERTTMSSSQHDLRAFLFRRRCACGCGRHADLVRGPAGWRGNSLPDRARWRGMTWDCAIREEATADADAMPGRDRLGLAY
jgi:hypothetical protein